MSKTNLQQVSQGNNAGDGKEDDDDMEIDILHWNTRKYNEMISQRMLIFRLIIAINKKLKLSVRIIVLWFIQTFK
jgi:hypothetical protein